MRYDEAASQSEFKHATLPTKVEGRTEIYDEASNSFFILEHDPLDTAALIASRKIGRGSRNSDLWTPGSDADTQAAVEYFKAKQEGRGVVIEKPWDMACMASPVNRAYRVKHDDGLLMLRTSDKSTWSEMRGNLLVRMFGPFKSYDGWEPMPEDHFYARVDLTGTNNIRLESDGHMGTQAHVVPHHDLSVNQPKKKKPPFPNATVAKVRDETFEAASVISQSLATAIGSTTGESQRALVEELKRLASHVSWHLREDRGKYQNRGNGGSE